MPPPRDLCDTRARRVLVRALPIAACVVAGVLVGLERAHDVADLGWPRANVVARGVADGAVTALTAMAMVAILARRSALLVRAIVACVALAWSPLAVLVAEEAFGGRFRAARVSREAVHDATLLVLVLAFEHPYVWLAIVAIAAPAIGGWRRARGTPSAEATDEAFVAQGLSIACGAVGALLAIRVHHDVAVTLLVAGTTGVATAWTAQARAVRRRRWLDAVARGAMPGSVVRDGDVDEAAPVPIVIDDGDATTWLVAEAREATAYREGEDAPSPIAAVRVRSLENVARAPSALDVVRRAAHSLSGGSWHRFGEFEPVGASPSLWTKALVIGTGGGAILVALGGMGTTAHHYDHKHHHSAEALRFVGAIEQGLRGYAHAHHRFPASAGPVPSAVPRAHAVRIADAWTLPPWSELGLASDAALRDSAYQYALETSPEGAHCFVRARGDSDGDGVEARFDMELAIDERGEAKRVGFTIEREDE
jgi:hypothetical protein